MSLFIFNLPFFISSLNPMLSVVSAHSVAGLTDVCYTKDGRFVLSSYLKYLIHFFSHFLTCGQDGDIHVFETKSDQAEHIRCADQCYCLAVHVRYIKINCFFIFIISGISYFYWNKSK
jgi:hypothetical protein